jgi:hypothetical protein
LVVCGSHMMADALGLDILSALAAAAAPADLVAPETPVVATGPGTTGEEGAASAATPREQVGVASDSVGSVDGSDAVAVATAEVATDLELQHSRAAWFRRGPQVFPRVGFRGQERGLHRA